MRNIAIVEDDKNSSKLLGEYLDKFSKDHDCKFTTSTFFTAGDYIENCRSGFDIVFMDIQMPRMNGYEAARTIRTLPAEWLRKIPIIAMTANVFQEDLEKAIDSGMNGHVTKPIDMNAVCEVLKKWLFRQNS